MVQYTLCVSCCWFGGQSDLVSRRTVSLVGRMTGMLVFDSFKCTQGCAHLHPPSRMVSKFLYMWSVIFKKTRCFCALFYPKTPSLVWKPLPRAPFHMCILFFPEPSAPCTFFQINSHFYLCALPLCVLNPRITHPIFIPRNSSNL